MDDSKCVAQENACDDETDADDVETDAAADEDAEDSILGTTTAADALGLDSAS